MSTVPGAGADPSDEGEPRQVSDQARSIGLLYIGGFDFPTPQARGIQSIHTAHALARAGWRVRVLAQRPGGRSSGSFARALASYGLAPHSRFAVTRLPVVRPGRVPGVGIHARLAVTNWSYGLGCLLDLLRGRFRTDVVLARDPRLAWIFIQTRRLHNRPVAYEVHEIFSVRPRDNSSLDPTKLRGVADRTRVLEQAVFDRADLLLPLTRVCADLLARDYGVHPSRTAVIPDGTMPTKGPLPPRDSASRTIVYAGQLYPWKGVNLLIEAITWLPEVRLVIYGGLPAVAGEDPNLADCRSLAERLGVTQRVAFAGNLPHRAIRGALAGAAAGIVPLPDRLMSRFFTSPLKVFDYMAAGVPIIAPDLPALREVLTDDQNALLVRPDDPSALAGAIERLLADPSQADRLRRRAFADVAGYTWDRRAERIIEAVSPMLGRRGDARRT